MAAWRRCESCRKVLPAEAFEGEATTCLTCLAGPPPKPARSPRASGVTTVRRATPPPATAGPTAPAERAPLLGVKGSGDLEVRERRARRVAMDQLAESNPEEFAVLLQNARQAEGLRG